MPSQPSVRARDETVAIVTVKKKRSMGRKENTVSEAVRFCPSLTQSERVSLPRSHPHWRRASVSGSVS